jgi:two-component SAPR family response regulator
MLRQMQNDGQQNVLNIKTLGVFELNYNDNTLLNYANRANKIMDLLKYFITNRGKKILPEMILEQLMPEDELTNPNNVLRSQIFRLRRFLEESFGKEAAEQYLKVTFLGRYYVFSIGPKTILDVDAFEEKIQEAKRLRSCDRQKAMQLYKEAVLLYEGEYLKEDADKEWLLSSRNHYSRLFIHALFFLIEMLKEEGNYAAIMEICEEATKIEPDEEAIHIYFIEALCKLGYKKHALSHYEYVINHLAKELGVKQSEALEQIYDKIITNQKDEDFIKPFHSQDQTVWEFNDSKGPGYSNDINDANQEICKPLMCSKENFMALFDLSKRRSSRQPNHDYLAIVTLLNRRKSLSIDKLKDALHLLSQVVLNTMRMGDVFAIWNDNQVLINVYNIASENLDIVSKRLNENVAREQEIEEFYLEIEFQPIMPQSTIEV